MARPGRKRVRQNLDELFADIAPSKRRRLMRMATECVDKIFEENLSDKDANGKPITARSRAETLTKALQGLEIVAGLAGKADAHEAHVRKLAEGLIGGEERVTVHFVRDDDTDGELGD